MALRGARPLPRPAVDASEAARGPFREPILGLDPGPKSVRKSIDFRTEFWEARYQRPTVRGTPEERPGSVQGASEERPRS